LVQNGELYYDDGLSEGYVVGFDYMSKTMGVL